MTKSSLSDLAALGGRALFDTPLHVNRPNAGSKQAFLSRVNEIWDSGWFTNDGPTVRELEARLEGYLQVPHCVLANNGTTAMSILLHALELSGEVILPSFTFVSTAHLLTAAGIRPVFGDIDPVSHDLAPRSCAQKFTPATSAVIATHIWGNPCQIEALGDLCAGHGVPLILDAAHAFGATHRGKPIGGFGTAEVFSFHATKAFHTFEGGAVTTADPALAERLRTIRNFGFSNYDQVDSMGINAKMSEIHAAMGLTNLEAFEITTDRCRAVYEIYREGLKGIDGLGLVQPTPGERSNFHYVPVIVTPERFGMSRDRLLELLHAENILARRYFYPGTHALDYYRDRVGDAAAHLPVTLDIGDRILVLPAGASLAEKDARSVCELIRFIAGSASSLALQNQPQAMGARPEAAS